MEGRDNGEDAHFLAPMGQVMKQAMEDPLRVYKLELCDRNVTRYSGRTATRRACEMLVDAKLARWCNPVGTKERERYVSDEGLIAVKLTLEGEMAAEALKPDYSGAALQKWLLNLPSVREQLVAAGVRILSVAATVGGILV